MKKLISSILILLSVSLFVVGAGYAQEGEPDWPTYSVQPGDTLYSISQRFGMTLDELVQANGVADPNSISVGFSLALPGVEWVSGALTNTTMPLGETLRSITRRYQTEANLIARLSGFVSPTQLAAGYPIMVPDGGIQYWELGRMAVDSGTSLLEMAVLSDNNPWAIKSINRLSGTWDSIPGDILFLPGTNDPGPGAFPSPISQLSFDGNSLVQGKTAVFRVALNGMPIDLSGNLLGQELHFFEDDTGEYIALQGIHVMMTPGQYPLSISGESTNGAKFNFNQMVLLTTGGYNFEEISVDEYLLDPELSASETAFINEIVSKVTPEKYWQGKFVPPSPYAGLYNSYFGTRRSFNGSAFTYYHGGLDYQGGTGVQIYAPAAGRVVFAGPLTIRGNATLIDHGLGVFSGYWHQSEIHVNVGDRVEQGQVIGLVGNTGRSSGAHLHWEILVGKIQVEPLDWLEFEYP
ncbi:MAG: peptidoglycan DD-metalloendopeptidase family protein [Chloroflexi bacterium]|nr:peptidoglycan DD-metalloendopeptidase family protein [Chloroflexota bacterium]MBT3668690.1 peptidoglycan DD-metalloendopeptidase family protein [Chloroflexota bacterium]MBT4003513.1 peptidoglycan DD-metalloendopeptidase family protein [Chloroflexota bacterium]MBT4305391.1 peptidoglycan DD-metalloendopeptidase family protein [Chloroflexota bacterium]MBT4532537.1 peptidoglycan DD-metalloendopeptidase family protein [Chloroflexota bacterium]